MPDPKNSASPLHCAFRGPNQVEVPEADLRKAIAAAANAERTRWLTGAGTRRKEDDDTVFPFLVCIWLPGFDSTLQPDTLVALQSAVSAVTYGNLTDTGLNSAIQVFNTADAAFEAAVDEVYKRSAEEDATRQELARLQVALKAAEQKERTSAQVVSQAKKDVSAAAKATPFSQVNLDAARKSLAKAEQDHQQNIKARTDAAAARDDAKKKLAKTSQELKKANDALPAARAARKKEEDAAGNWTATDREKARKDLLKSAGITAPSAVSKFIDTALESAHKSRADAEPWSAAFVGAQVRAAAIGLKLEVIDGRVHRGKDRPLKISRRHSDYIIDARDRAVPGKYHAFEPAKRAVGIGDIVCTDRTEFIKSPDRQTLKGLKTGTLLHGDIVVEIGNGANLYAETIGGNVAHSVRRRRYPLDKDGKLIVAQDVLIDQEDDSGKFGSGGALPFPKLPFKPTLVDRRSTFRIFALLSPVPDCKTAPKARANEISGLESPFLEEVLVAGTPEPSGGRRSESEIQVRLEPVESPFLVPELFASEPDDSWETSVAELETAGPFDSEFEQESEREATSYVEADDNAEQGPHEFEQDQEDPLSWDHRVADEFETEAAGFEESVFQDDPGREEPGPMEFHIPGGSTSPTLGFEFDLNYGFEDKVVDAKGLSPPAGHGWPREGLKATDHEGRSGSSLKDGFVVTMDAVRLEISTVPFVISNDAEFKSISDAVKNFGQELIDAPKTFESGLVVPDVSGHPTTFTHPRTVVNKPELLVHGDIAFPGDRDHATYKLASVPLVIHRLNKRYPTKTDLWAAPQATLTLPLSQFGKLVWLIHVTKGGLPGEALTGRDSDRLGLRDDLAWIALKRAVAERKKKVGTSLSDGSKLTEADFTCVTPVLTILLMYMLTSIILDPVDAKKEAFAKGSLPLNIKTPLWQIHKFALSDREKLVLHELYTDTGKRRNLFTLASGKMHEQGRTKLFPAHTHVDVERFLDVPTWQGLVDALVKEKPVKVTKDNRIEKKGHLKGNEILIAPLSSKIDWSKTQPNIAVEMRRIGFAPVVFAKWPGLMKRIRELAKKVNA